ncbi:MAG: adenylate kinase [Terriglobia bacterium]
MAELARPVVLLGAPGAGKGTQAREVAKHFGVPQIATGDMFRDHAARGTELGRQAKPVTDRGALVSDEIVSAMVDERIRQADCRRGFLLDGFPRTLPQAERLKEILADASFAPLLAVNLEVSYDNLLRRLTGRRTCKTCGAIYNLYDRSPSVPARCDRDGGELVQRADDREEVIRERLAAYERQTKPLIEYYRQRDALVEVNGDESPEALTRRLIQLLEVLPAPVRVSGNRGVR